MLATFISKKNLITAGVGGIAALLAMTFTAKRSNLTRGLATTGALVLALPLAGKFTGAK